MDARSRVWGYTGAMGMTQGLSAGYFLWDLWTGVMDFDVHGWGVVAHAASALAVSSLGFVRFLYFFPCMVVCELVVRDEANLLVQRPFLNYYGMNFILYELSTPFLNIHWFMDKLNLTGSTAQLVNGITLIATFGCSRLLWGTYQSVRMYQDVWLALQAPEELPVPPWLALSYLASTTALSVLNFYWFARMIQTIGARFDKSKSKKTDKKEQ